MRISRTQLVILHGGDHDYALGDVNHDNSVNISDVTALINYLLSPEQQICTICADTDGNQAVNISDVTKLIEFLLTGSWSEN